LKPYFLGSRSFKVIDVGTPGKLVSSTCYETRDSRLSYGEDAESLSHSVVSAPGRDGRTDRQDRIAIANTHLSSTCRYSCGA